MDKESPCLHFRGFEEAYATINLQNISVEQLSWRSSHPPLKDKVKMCFHSLRPNLIGWGMRAKEFIKKFFPSRRKNYLHKQIVTFP